MLPDLSPQGHKEASLAHVGMSINFCSTRLCEWPKKHSTTQSNVDYEQFTILLLRSEGGLIEIEIKIGNLLGLNRMDVFVPENCESACVIIALLGEQLYIAPYARFGFHSGCVVASNSCQLGRFIGNAATEDYVLALGARGVPKSILGITKATPSNDM